MKQISILASVVTGSPWDTGASRAPRENWEASKYLCSTSAFVKCFLSPSPTGITGVVPVELLYVNCKADSAVVMRLEQPPVRWWTPQRPARAGKPV